jgi:predicted N-acetyltransferase YhbS
VPLKICVRLKNLKIRQEKQVDIKEIRALNKRAFGQNHFTGSVEAATPPHAFKPQAE